MGKRVLVIDDEPAVGELVKILLVREGYEVETARNGREGLELIGTARPHLIITDITMPDMEGIEFMSTVKKMRLAIPIITMSGNVIGRNFLKVTEVLGAAATLTKPFSSEELLSAVKAALA